MNYYDYFFYLCVHFINFFSVGCKHFLMSCGHCEEVIAPSQEIVPHITSVKTITHLEMWDFYQRKLTKYNLPCVIIKNSQISPHRSLVNMLIRCLGEDRIHLA